MDPNANLAELRRLVAKQLNGDLTQDEIHRMAELVEALDGWLSKGGALPNAWLHFSKR